MTGSRQDDGDVGLPLDAEKWGAAVREEVQKRVAMTGTASFRVACWPRSAAGSSGAGIVYTQSSGNAKGTEPQETHPGSFLRGRF